jgi:hypothetical protein
VREARCGTRHPLARSPTRVVVYVCLPRATHACVQAAHVSARVPDVGRGDRVAEQKIRPTRATAVRTGGGLHSDVTWSPFLSLSLVDRSRTAPAVCATISSMVNVSRRAAHDLCRWPGALLIYPRDRYPRGRRLTPRSTHSTRYPRSVSTAAHRL